MLLAALIPCHAKVINYKVKRGDSLSKILYGVGIAKSGQMAHQIDKISNRQIRNYIQPGKYIYIQSEGPFLQKLIFKVSTLKSYEIVIDNTVNFPQKIKVKEVIKETYKRIAYFSGEITKENNSIYKAGKVNSEKFLTDDVIDQMAEILGWRIDFEKDVRVGDEFKLIYEEVLLDNQKLFGGDILAIEYNQVRGNNIKKHQAIMFEQDGVKRYFDLNGESVQKAFLRYPVQFSRISSKFRARYHPILKRWKAHSGVDFAAPRGTPVYAAGDGRVIEKKYNKGYGYYVTLQHNNGVKTRYAHLSRFAKGLARGKYVSKKQTIGYVGSTGYATGPHLHYEFIKNGLKLNPLKVRIPSAHPIAATEKLDFTCLANYWADILNSKFLIDPIIVSRKPGQCQLNRLSTDRARKKSI